MPTTTHYALEKAGAAGVQNKWALYDGNFDRIEAGRTFKATAGGALAAGDLVYLNSSRQAVKATNANRPLLGFALSAASAGQDVYVRQEGLVTVSSWAWTPGSLLYPSTTTAGALTATPTSGVFQPPVAVALTATTIWIFTGGLQAVLADGSVGTAKLADGSVTNPKIANSAVTSDKISPPLRLADGSAAAPTYSYSGDTDTGIYRAGADTLAIATGGTDRVRVEPPGDGEVALLVQRNVGGTYTVQKVLLGPPDSGGTGYRVLRVPN